MGVEIQRVQIATDEVVQAFQRLLPQLSQAAVSVDAQYLQQLLGWPGVNVLLARVDSEIMGTLTLVLFPIPTGVRAWVEDVVVDESARGRGVGAALTKEALRLAFEGGARKVDLTSRPSREAANRLYEKLGFRVRESKLYRYSEPE